MVQIHGLGNFKNKYIGNQRENINYKRYLLIYYIQVLINVK